MSLDLQLKKLTLIVIISEGFLRQAINVCSQRWNKI